MRKGGVSFARTEEEPAVPRGKLTRNNQSVHLQPLLHLSWGPYSLKNYIIDT